MMEGSKGIKIVVVMASESPHVLNPTIVGERVALCQVETTVAVLEAVGDTTTVELVGAIMTVVVEEDTMTVEVAVDITIEEGVAVDGATEMIVEGQEAHQGVPPVLLLVPGPS